MPCLSYFPALVGLCSLLVGAVTLPAESQSHHIARASHPSIPPPPSQDPWYKAPSGYQHAKPGQVLKVRQADGLAQRTNASAAYNLLYRTTDSNQQASWAVTTLYMPQNTSKTPLLSYQVAYDSPDVDDSPSCTFYTGPVDPPVTQGLAQGWTVNVPDYEGPLAAFTAGEQSGHATLDSIRAVLNYEKSLRNAKHAMFGYSGGALASGWAAELQAHYAPELRFAGVALGGFPPNQTSIYESVNEQWGAALIVTSMLGITAESKPAREALLSELNSSGLYNASTFLKALHQNITTNIATYQGQNIFDYFKDGAGILQNPTFRGVLNRDGTLGNHGVPVAPLYIYKAVHDEVSKVADTDDLVHKYCKAGANILYLRDNIGGHVAEITNGAPGAMDFLQSALNGTYSHSGCTIQTATTGNDTSAQ